MGNNFVYMLQIECSTHDDKWIETYLFYHIKKAKQVMKNIIKNEKANIYENVFDKKGNLIDKNYRVDTNINKQHLTSYWWNISNELDWYTYTKISLHEIEVEL